jgi:hypothetical protein
MNSGQIGTNEFLPLCLAIIKSTFEMNNIQRGHVMSGVAPDAVVQRAMRHTSPETKRHYQLGMADQVRQAMEKSNKKAYGRGRLLHSYDSGPNAKKEGVTAVCK